jgi:hypothetical protein
MADDGKITIQLDPRTAQQLAERAREEGVSPEQYAAEVVTEIVAEQDSDRWPPLSISDEELRASIEQQRRDIAAGTATLYSHEEVMAGARAILAKARDAKP